MSTKKLQNNDIFIAKVIIENFPSRVELYQILDSFLQDRKQTKDYTSDDRDNMVFLTFKNSVKLF